MRSSLVFVPVFSSLFLRLRLVMLGEWSLCALGEASTFDGLMILMAAGRFPSNIIIKLR